MPWTNYHSHTHYCDGVQDPLDYLRAAEAQGMPAYGISSHAPLPWKEIPWGIKMEEFPSYLAEVRALRGASPVQIYLGLEVDYVPGHIGPHSPYIKEAQLDYTIGSVHMIDFLETGLPWEMDGPYIGFLHGFKELFHNDLQAMIRRYYALTRQMVREECPDVVGHIDKVKMHNHDGTTWDESAPWYQKEVRKTLEAVRESGAIVEVNTRGIYKKHAASAYPSAWVLSEIQQMGIPIMLNSDSHHPREISSEFDPTAELLLSLGFRELYALIDQEWQPFAFDQEGLKLPHAH